MKLRWLLQRQRLIKTELCVRLSVLRLFQVDHVGQSRRCALLLDWHEWFSFKGKEWKIYSCRLPLSSEHHKGVWQTTTAAATKTSLQNRSLPWVKCFAIFQCWSRSAKQSQLYFRLLGTNGFHIKAENERFTASGSRSRQSLKYENSRRRLPDYVKTLHQKACRTCSTITFPHRTNQIIDMWRCRCRRRFPKHVNLTSSFGRLPIVCQKITPKSVPFVQDDYFSSFTQSNYWFTWL